MNETWPDEPVEPARPFPWPPPTNGPVLRALADTWKQATFEPGRFFARLPRHGDTGPAVLYYLAIGILVAGASLFWESLTGNLALGQDVVVIGEGPMVQPVVAFLLSPLILLLGLFLSAAVTHLVLVILRGATHGIGTTTRVFAYAYSPMVFGVVPLLGTIIGGIWLLVVAILGLASAHETPHWKPIVAVVVPFLILMGLFAAALVVVVATGAGVA